MKRSAPAAGQVPARRGRRPKLRAASVRRKNLRLDQAKLDLLRDRLGVATDQEVVERVIDEAVIDRELIDATLALGGVVPDLVDIGKRR
jgi:hypothetical protein